ncbi:MAG: polyphosphate kinase 2 family protein [Planctomycetaceae bacterium]|nr:polyphosphate kinase 2 family protein [Planctomycetaceae bacterium]
MPNHHRLDSHLFQSLDSVSTLPPADSPVPTDAAAEFKVLRKELVKLQRVLYAQHSDSLLVVFQALDAGGKDGAIRKVFKGVNPQGVRVASFKRPTKLELDHDFLWRVQAHSPARGMISIFNRSHYEDVIATRVRKIIDVDVCNDRYDQINNFEYTLNQHGTTILKFYLHISKDEQKRRFQERLSNPTKHWKFSAADLETRKQWSLYMAAYGDALKNCHRELSPWHIIPSDDKSYRNLVIARVIVQTLQKMRPQFPAPESGLQHITID